jgi:hypothetical protein
MATSASALTKSDYIDLVHGKFHRTNAADLNAAFQAFVASGTNHLAVYFHGGLVGRASAMNTAGQLIDGYRGAGVYPFFFIWNSDLITALSRRLDPFAGDLPIRRVIEQHILFISSRMLDMHGFSSEHRETLRRIANRPREELPPSLEALAELGDTIDAIWAQRAPGSSLPQWQDELPGIQAFEEALFKDATLAAFGHWLNQAKRFTPRLGGGIMYRVWQRLNSGHDHGLYTTLIEEVAIAIGMDAILAGIWQRMKTDIDDAFRADLALYGGTAFLDGLSKVWNGSMRLTLIGHSAGSIYINRMLNALDDRLAPDVNADIALIAGALSCEAIAETIDREVFERRVGHYRCFALKDEREGGYWEVPGVYNKSILYLISALCERDGNADKTLFGMQRYWSSKSPYDGPELKKVTDAIVSTERVWSPTAVTEPDGHRAKALHHVGFALDGETDASVQHFLRYA